MKQKLLDIRFVNQAARTEWKRELGRSLTKPQPAVKRETKPKPEGNPLWQTRLR